MAELTKSPGLSDLDQLCVQTIRFLAADAVQKANAGHPGMPVPVYRLGISVRGNSLFNIVC